MISEQGPEAARLGRHALDQALVALGCRPVDENPDFRATEPVVIDIPTVVLDKSGCAPLRFVFGIDLDIWVGPYSEIVIEPILEARAEQAQHRIEQVLRSSVTCRPGRWWFEIALQLPGDLHPWTRRKHVGRGQVPLLLPAYAPYV